MSAAHSKLAAALAFALLGCGADRLEADLEKLDDPMHAPDAARRLVASFDDAVDRDGSSDGPGARAVLDRIVVPLTLHCTEDPRQRSRILRMVADARDRRGASCVAAALADYAASPGEHHDALGAAVRAARVLAEPSLSRPLFHAFRKLHAASSRWEPRSELHDALVALGDPVWESDAIALLEPPLGGEWPEASMNQAYWQGTAVDLLGALRSSRAVRPLLAVAVDPAKFVIAPAAVAALVRIGKPTLAPSLALLRSEDRELVLRARLPDVPGQIEAASPHVPIAAAVLGSLGLPAARGPLVAALAGADPVMRALIARQLPRLPPGPDSIAAIQRTWKETPAGLTIVPGVDARESLIEAAAAFYDPSIVPWLVDATLALKGDRERVDSLRAAALRMAIWLMEPGQVERVKKLYDVRVPGHDGEPVMLGAGYEREWSAATQVLTECHGRASRCALDRVQRPAPAGSPAELTALKAAWMIGTAGDTSIREDLLACLSRLQSRRVLIVAAGALDRLSPDGDAAMAKRLERVLAERTSALDADPKLDAPLRTLASRLAARAR
jgi:hypothetical protein